MKKRKKKIIAIIPAAGVGKRMNNLNPKQYLKIAGKTIIEHTLSFLIKEKRISKFIVSLKKNDNIFKKLSISKNKLIQTVTGGKRRTNSVLSGLNFITKYLNLNDCWVLIHDAVRPFLAQEDLNNILKFIENNYSSHGGILATPAKDTIKYSKSKEKKIICTIERNRVWHALTPQFFPIKLIQNCLINSLKKKIVINDDSSALEICGYHPKLIKSKSNNFKITTPEDLILAEFYYSKLL